MQAILTGAPDRVNSAPVPNVQPCQASVRPTTVSAILAAAQDAHFSAPTTYTEDVPVMPIDCPSLAAASTLWCLNEKQHLAFVLMGSAILERTLLRLDPEQQEQRQRQQQGIDIINKILTQARERYMKTADTPEDYEGSFAQTCANSHNLRMFLGGSGGTGKSRVIRCVTDFARRWNVLEMVEVTATTGVAATLLNGSTYFNSMKLPGMGGCGKLPDEALITRWQSVGLLIIDETSFISRKQLWTIHQRLTTLRPASKTQLFGGVHIVLSGDFFQLTSQSKAVFTHPDALVDDNDKAGGSSSEDGDEDGNAGQKSRKRQAARLENIKGYLLWSLGLNCAVELLENYRQRHDPEFAAAVNRLRTNSISLADIRFFNQFVISPTHQPPPGTFFATCSNKERCAANLASFYSYLAAHPIDPGHPQSWRERKALRIIADVNETDRSNPLDQDRISHVRASPEKALGNRPGSLDIIIGSKIMINGNLDVPRRVANGTKAIVLDVLLEPGAEPALISLPGAQNIQVHSILCSRVRALVLKLDHKDHCSENYYPEFTSKECDVDMTQADAASGLESKEVELPPSTYAIPNGVVILKRTDKDNTTVRKFTWKTATFSAQITQFQASSCCLASTGHKVQGATLKAILMGPPNRSKFNHNGWVYVCISRVTKREELFLFEALSEKIMSYKPRRNIITEMRRLRAELEGPTLQLLLKFCPQSSIGDSEASALDTSVRRFFSFASPIPATSPAKSLQSFFSTSTPMSSSPSSARKKMKFSFGTSTAAVSSSSSAKKIMKFSFAGPTAAAVSIPSTASSSDFALSSFGTPTAAVSSSSSAKKKLKFSFAVPTATAVSIGSTASSSGFALSTSSSTSSTSSLSVNALSHNVHASEASGLINEANHCYLLSALQLLHGTSLIQKVFTAASWADFTDTVAFGGSVHAVAAKTVQVAKLLYYLFANITHQDLSRDTCMDYIRELVTHLGFPLYTQQDVSEAVGRLQVYLEGIHYHNVPCFRDETWCGFRVATNSVLNNEHCFSMLIEASELSSLQHAVARFCKNTFQSQRHLVTTKGRRFVIPSNNAFEVKSAPAFLQVFIKRYAPDRTKVTAKILYDPIIRITINSCEHAYKLIAVSCHHGESMNAGHYTTFRCDASARWWHCNDNSKQQVKLQAVLQHHQEVCICFYEKLDSISESFDFLPPNQLSVFKDRNSPASVYLDNFNCEVSGCSGVAPDYQLPWMRQMLLSIGFTAWLSDKLIDGAGQILNAIHSNGQDITTFMISAMFHVKLMEDHSTGFTTASYRYTT